MRRRIGNICMILGAALVLAALSLFLWNQNEDRQAGASAESILPEVIEQIETADGEETDPYDPSMVEKIIDSDAYIGYLTLPSLDLELPVLSEWDYTRLQTAPCRYAGSTKTDDLVIAAHNYSSHFGQIQNLSPGDMVMFTDMDGTVFRYMVEGMELLKPSDTAEMTAGDYDLTLFTCNYSGQSRVTVRCRIIK